MKIFLKILLLWIILLILIIVISEQKIKPTNIKYGVTFTPKYAKYLGLDWQKTYLQILDELKVKNLRLASYWDVLEEQEGKYDFSQTDFLLQGAAKREAKVVLVVGIRQPRWPECHIPNWAKSLSVLQRKQKILQFIQKIVEKYKENKAIWAWQVENETFLADFGEGCDSPDENFLRSEIELVKKLDSSRPIILTDSGELGGWGTPIKYADIFGFSVYRTVHNPVLGYQTYPLTPVLYSLKAALFQKFLNKPKQETMVIELQAEPWLAAADSLSSAQKQFQIFSPKDFQNNIEFAKKIGFEQNFLWGVEWWYFMEKMGFPQYLDYAKSLFR